MAEGYFDAFSREESKLGMGANASVFLCQHVLDGNLLGRFAVKKIAIGPSRACSWFLFLHVVPSLGYLTK